MQHLLCLTASKTRHIRSDCGTAFVDANNVLQKKFPERSWEFSTAASSQHQGTVERQIRTFKEVCDGILGADNQKRLSTDFELVTICCEAEYIMNTRLLEKFIVDQDDFKPLRPINLLTGHLNPLDNDILFSKTTTAKDKLRRGHQYTHRLSQEWWQKWTNRYMLSLQRRSKGRSDERNFKKGDLVFLEYPTTQPIGRYPYAVVESLKYCPDGRVRFATVRLSDGCVRESDIRKLVTLKPASNGQ